MENKKINNPMHIELNTLQEFEDWASIDNPNSENKLILSKNIVNTILNNLDQKQVHIFEVLVKEVNTIYDISVVEKDFIFTLEKNLKILEFFEEYELCEKVNNTINQLKNGQKN
jgi:hypothetical protein